MERADTAVRDDRLIPLTRWAFTPLAVFTAIFGPLLYLFPGGTDDYWAWEIAPDMSAAWVGAGYTFGALAIWTILIIGEWKKLYVPIVATWTFSTVMLIATVVHWDRFFTDRPTFWIWFAIYAFLPVGLPVVWALNSRRASPARPDDLLLPRSVVLIAAAAGVADGALGLLMVVSPSTAHSFWPWELTPLMSRVIAGWILFMAAGALCPLIERRYVAYREFVPEAAIWFLLILIAAVRFNDEFDTGRPATYIFFGVLIVVIVALIGMSVVFERLHRATVQGQPAPEVTLDASGTRAP